MKLIVSANSVVSAYVVSVLCSCKVTVFSSIEVQIVLYPTALMYADEWMRLF